MTSEQRDALIAKTREHCENGCAHDVETALLDALDEALEDAAQARAQLAALREAAARLRHAARDFEEMDGVDLEREASERTLIAAEEYLDALLDDLAAARRLRSTTPQGAAESVT